MNSHDTQTSTPAIKPMIAEAIGFTKPLGAVMATRPARNALPLIEASGLPYRIHMYRMPPKDPVIPASIVLTATDAARRPPLPDIASVEPGLKPNQPNARMKQPHNTHMMSWPGIALGLDRKSTRLNSSHVAISYAVFCLKKKKT